MIQVTTFFVLSLLGALNAGYLTYKHRVAAKKPLVCPLNHDCSKVTESRYSTMLGVRNEMLGLLFFIGLFGAMLTMTLLPALGETLRFWLRLGAAGGAGFSLLLVGIQAFKLKDYCFYCMISAGISLLICVNAFYL
jgi:uncharacterized membrane protein